MKISIVTPVYNEPRVSNCIESVQSQRGDFEVEHIVVDGMSTDETKQIIETNRDHIDSLLRGPDDGLYDAMNKGIAFSSGDIIGILNADDVYQDPYALADVAQTMRETDADACYGDLVYVDQQDDIVRYWNSGAYDPRKFYRGWMPPHPTFFARREVYESNPLFDLNFSIAADYELMLRLLVKHGISVEYLDRVLVRMAIGGKSNESIGNAFQAVREMYQVWKKHDMKARYFAPFLHPIDKLPQFFSSPPIDEEVNTAR